MRRPCDQENRTAIWKEPLAAPVNACLASCLGIPEPASAFNLSRRETVLAKMRVLQVARAKGNFELVR